MAPSSAAPRALRLAAKVGVTGALLAWVFTRTDLGAAAAALRAAEPGWVAAAAFAFALNVCLGAVRWCLVLRSVGVAVPLPAALRVCWSAQFWNAFVPGGVAGDALRGAWLCRAAEPVRAVSSVVLDRVAAFAALAMVVGAGLLTPAGRALPAAPALGAAAALLGGAALLVLAFPAGVLRAAARIGGPWLGKRLGGGLEQAGAAAPRAAALGLAVVLHALVVLAFAALARALSTPIGLAPLFVVVPAVTLTAYVPVSISGLGVREVALVGLLAPAGVPAAQAVALSLLFLAVSLGTSLIGAVVHLCGGARVTPTHATANPTTTAPAKAT